MWSFKYPLLLANLLDAYNRLREPLPWIAVTSRAVCPSWCLSLWEVRLLTFLFVCWLDYKLCKDRGLVYLSSVMPPQMPFYSSCYEGNQAVHMHNLTAPVLRGSECLPLSEVASLGQRYRASSILTHAQPWKFMEVNTLQENTWPMGAGAGV